MEDPETADRITPPSKRTSENAETGSPKRSRPNSGELLAETDAAEDVDGMEKFDSDLLLGEIPQTNRSMGPPPLPFPKQACGRRELFCTCAKGSCKGLVRAKAEEPYMYIVPGGPCKDLVPQTVPKILRI